MSSVERLKIRIFADGADRASMLELHGRPYIKGLTTNPTLMRKAGVVPHTAAVTPGSIHTSAVIPVKKRRS